MTVHVPAARVSLDPLIDEANRRARQRRTRVLLALLVALGAVAAATLSLHPFGGAGGPPAGSQSALAPGSTVGPFAPAANEQARRLLSEIVVPPGAQRLRVEPRGDGGALRLPDSWPGTRQRLDLRRFWLVHRTGISMGSFVERLPRGTTRVGTSVNPSETTGGPPSQGADYSVPACRGMDVCHVALVLVSLPDGWTGIRVDAQVGRGWPHLTEPPH